MYLLNPGDSVLITTISGQRLSAVQDLFVVVDYFKSEMSEYDNNYVFVPLDYLQHLRTMQDRVTSIQIKLKNYDDAPAVVKRLRALFQPDSLYRVSTWEEKQGPLLSAIAVERGILNVLLFLIIAVAGFGILAIFSMIVTEKTRDIGVLKALGASNRGVMAIFLGYGLLLGLVGAGLGTFLGVQLTEHINDVERLLSSVTGHDVFPRDVYYFSTIPTDIQPFNVVLLNLGAVAIAVFFSVLPALRAAMLHPVRALRYE
jgi:lipoprotein-releasing system permease protein